MPIGGVRLFSCTALTTGASSLTGNASTLGSRPSGALQSSRLKTSTGALSLCNRRIVSRPAPPRRHSAFGRPPFRRRFRRTRRCRRGPCRCRRLWPLAITTPQTDEKRERHGEKEGERQIKWHSGKCPLPTQLRYGQQKVAPRKKGMRKEAVQIAWKPALVLCT